MLELCVSRKRSRVRSYVQNRLLKEAGWSWYEGDC